MKTKSKYWKEIESNFKKAKEELKDIDFQGKYGFQRPKVETMGDLQLFLMNNLIKTY